MVQVSVIVPVFNVEKYLVKCIESLINQSFSDYEIILVDDGSNDGSELICDKYAEKYKNVKVLHKENGGLSDARNYGINYSNSKYVIFVDSDDYVSPDYVEYLVKLKKKYNCDIAISGYISEKFSGVVKNIVNSRTEFLCLPKYAFQLVCYGRVVPIMAWAKIYNRQLLLKHPFPVGKLNEDVGTIYKLILASNKVAIGNRANYHYVQRPGSILHSDNKEKGFYGVVSAAKIVKVAKEKLKDNESVRAAYGRFIIESVGLLHRSSSDKNIYLDGANLIKRKYNSSIFSVFFIKGLTLSKRGQFILFYLSPKLYRIIYLCRKRRSDS